MNRVLTCLFSFLVFEGIASVAAFAIEQCPASEAVHHGTVVDKGRALCCGSGVGRAKQRRCLRNAMKRLKSASKVLTKSRVVRVNGTFKQMHDNGCTPEVPAAATTTLSCNPEEMFSISEALERIESSACNLKYSAQRKSRLRKLRRSLSGARTILGRSFVGEVGKGIKRLRRSMLCGEGGETPLIDCHSVGDPRDGTGFGNLYKLSDHDGLPVFLTHNSAGSGVILSPLGETLDTLRYTGLANPDSSGNRHHYRFSRSCGSLPEGFLMKIGNTCYSIDEPCSRID